MTRPRTIFDKIWDEHTITTDDSGQTLLYVDWLLFAESSFNEFDVLHFEGYKVRSPKQVFGVADHYTSSRGTTLADVIDVERRNLILTLERNAREGGFTFFGLGDPRRGIQHLVGPEQGLAQPGIIMLCIDSHTATQGAVGALAYGVGGDLDHALATQTIWQRKPKQMRINVEGKRGVGVASKDVILAILAEIGTDGGVQHSIEYAGSVIRDMSVEERMTVCNMSIEAGSPAGTVAPDAKTFEYVQGRPFAPRAGEQWDAALAYWKTLPSDRDAPWDKEVTLDGDQIQPMVTWGNSPEDGVPITDVVPDPSGEPDAQRRAGMERSLEYMGLRPGTRMTDIAIDQVFIGSCTNGRIEDLRDAAAIVKGRKVVVSSLVVPGSSGVKRQAESEGLDRIFKEAGFYWGEAGCSMCISLNGDAVPAGKRCASTSNRNFQGRQGKGSRTHLVSPAMAAAAAVTGRLADVRDLIR
jgi:3-isopropylmalate/(R)-2-methylmalate dehydratase large subunit